MFPATYLKEFNEYSTNYNYWCAMFRLHQTISILCSANIAAQEIKSRKRKRNTATLSIVESRNVREFWVFPLCKLRKTSMFFTAILPTLCTMDSNFHN